MEDIIKFSANHDFVMKKYDTNGQEIILHVPFALNSSPFSSRLYDKACALGPLWNTLIQKLTMDGHFIDAMVQRLKGMDAFVLKLYTIEKKYREQNRHSLSLAILRSDYLMHDPYADSDDCTKNISSIQTVLNRCQLKQVEINTISSSFMTLSKSFHDTKRSLGLGMGAPENNGQDLIAMGIAKAMEHFNQLHSIHKSIAIMVVQANERNYYDQQRLITELEQKYSLNMERVYFHDILEKLDYKPDTNTFSLKGTVISLFYFRAGYMPYDYTSIKAWNIRELIESSIAIKCPSIGCQLVGMKKAQQMLYDPSLLKKYVTEDEPFQRLYESFMGLYPLEDTESSKALLKKVISCPENYVLKPQREGGGNNLTGPAMVQYIETHHSDLPAFIIMEKIKAPSFPNVLVREGTGMEESKCISELGIYGICLWQGENILFSQSGGYLLRTKSAHVSEGGVAAGYAFIDSPRLL